MMHANALKSIFISIPLLLLVLLSVHSAMAQQETGPSHMGVLAYIQSGDLWLKELPKGQAKRLTSDGRNCCPSWSPSGRRLAYLKDNELWVVQSSGADAKALSSGAKVNRFAWSSVSDTLAYETPQGVRVVRAGDWHEREVFAESSSWAWSPDGRWLAYGRMRVLEVKEWGAEVDAGLWRIRADGSGATELFKSDQPIIVSGWYGEHILFHRASSSWISPPYINRV